MKEVDIRQVAVNNHIYNLKKRDLDENKKLQVGNSASNYTDGDRLDQLKKYIESGAYILNYEPVFELLFKLNMFEHGFLNFLQRNYLKDKKSYTTATGNLILQDALNVMYLLEPVNFEKYSYVLVETNEQYITDKDQQLNKELVLTLPSDKGMLAPHEEVVNVIRTVGWKNLILMIELINKVNIQTV